MREKTCSLLVTSLLFAVVVAASAVTGCTEATPGYCEATSDCDSGNFCNLDRHACEPRQDVGVAEGGADGPVVDAPAGQEGGVDGPEPDGLIVDGPTPDSVKPPKCGNDVKEQGEECDGADFGSSKPDCKSKGFECGSIKCSGCKLDLSGCKTGWVQELPFLSFPKFAAVDGSGNTYITGLVSDALKFGTKTIPGGTQRVYVAKLNDKKQFVWATASTGELYDVKGLALDTNGNAYVIGGYGKKTNFGVYTLEAKDSCMKEVYIAKLESNGKWAWAKSVGGASSGCDFGSGITLDGGNNVYITGSTGSTQVSIVGKTFNAIGGQNAYVAKLLPTDGQLVWARVVGVSTGNIRGVAVDTDLAGNSYLYGELSTDSKAVVFDLHQLQSTSQSFDIFVAKLNPSGTFLWATGGGGANTETATAMATDAAGNTYVTGKFESSTASFGISTLTMCPTCINYFKAKLTSSGSFSWAKADSQNEVTGIVIGAGSAPLVFGSYTGSSTFGASKLTSTGGKDIFISKLAPSTGAYASAVTAGGKNDDTADGMAYKSGVTYTFGVGGPATFGAHSLSKAAANYLWKSGCLLP